ncbi:MAG: hypothetical protein JWO91_1424, partial [Acidobacteriaceae bacterium]|nr:hypothetical protein [Acidobacteriaceae bacterium]
IGSDLAVQKAEFLQFRACKGFESLVSGVLE